MYTGVHSWKIQYMLNCAKLFGLYIKQSEILGLDHYRQAFHLWKMSSGVFKNCVGVETICGAAPVYCRCEVCLAFTWKWPLQSHESIPHNEFLPMYVHILLVLFLWRTLTDIYFIFIFGLGIYNQNNCFLTIASLCAYYKKRWKCLKNPCRFKALSLRNVFHPVIDQMKLFT